MMVATYGKTIHMLLVVIVFEFSLGFNLPSPSLLRVLFNFGHGNILLLEINERCMYIE